MNIFFLLSSIHLFAFSNLPPHTIYSDKDVLISAAALRSHVDFLASDKLEGRMSGTEGERAAGEYIAKWFKDHGLKPAGPNGSYFQEFPITYGGEAGPKCELIFTTSNAKKITAEANKDFNPVYGSVEKTPIEGEVVFVGEGRVSENRDDYEGLDVKGKIVMLFPASPGDRFNNNARSRVAKEKGAVGMIFAGPIEEDSYPLMRVTRIRSISRDSGLAAVAISANLFEKVSGLKYKDARKTAASGYVPRGFAKGLKAKIKVDIQPRKITARNVMAMLPGNDPKLKNQYIIIGAHYDHVGWGDIGALDATEKIHNGADDNASGTSTVLELARLFAQTKDNRRTLVFQLYSGEELGLVGSFYFTKNPTIDLNAVHCMINLDMVGNLTDDKLELDGLATSTAWEDIVSQLTNGFKIAKKGGPRGDSDHYAFAAAGIPVLFFHTGLHERYHRATDDAPALNYEGMAKVGNLVAKYIRAVDKQEELLPFKKGEQITKRKPPTKESPTGETARRVRVGLIPDYTNNEPGVLLAGVSANSPAEKAGLKAGDRIIQWGTKKINSIEDLQEIFETAEPGKPVKVKIVRGGKEIEITITPEAIDFINKDSTKAA